MFEIANIVLKPLKMLSYDDQLDLKRDVVVRAYKTFSGKSVPYAKHG